MKRVIPGINIQWPITRLILEGKKVIETRKYPLPEKYKNVELAIIETPGPQGRKAGMQKAQIVGTIIFEDSFEYKSKAEFDRDIKRHFVEPDHPQFKFQKGVKKFGWIIKSVKVLKSPKPGPRKKGIVFASQCEI